MLNVNDGYKKLIIKKFREVPITMHIRDIEIAILDFIDNAEYSDELFYLSE